MDSTSIKKTPPTCPPYQTLTHLTNSLFWKSSLCHLFPTLISQSPFILRKKHKKACVVPRPIGWISTRSPKGKDNLAPYSQFNNLTFDPPYVMFSSNRTPEGKRKDTVINAETTGKLINHHQNPKQRAKKESRI